MITIPEYEQFARDNLDDRDAWHTLADLYVNLGGLSQRAALRRAAALRRSDRRADDVARAAAKLSQGNWYGWELGNAIRAWAGVQFGEPATVYVLPGRARPRATGGASFTFSNDAPICVTVGALFVIRLAKLLDDLLRIPGEVRTDVVGMLLGIV